MEIGAVDVKSKSKSKGKDLSSDGGCGRCGKQGCNACVCPHKETVCRVSGKAGHLAKMCPAAIVSERVRPLGLRPENRLAEGR